MATLIETTDAAAVPVALVVRGTVPDRMGERRADWIEATMRRCEIPSVVDIAKCPDADRRLIRLLGL